MIEIAGSARRTFLFPADVPTAFAYYSDTSRILSYLPHICVARAYGYDQFRLLYSTAELGIYRIRIFCDLHAKLDAKSGWHAIYISPLQDISPVKAEAGLNSSTAQGYYTSTSIFRAEGDRTRINFSMTLEARLPPPRALRFVPVGVVNGIARSITRSRIREIASGFIQRSIDAFPYWLEEMQQPGKRRRARLEEIQLSPCEEG